MLIAQEISRRMKSRQEFLYCTSKSGTNGNSDLLRHLLNLNYSWGLSTLPFLSIIVQYIDSITGFSSGNGYHTNHMDYIFESPLVYMGVVFCINIILAIAYLIYCFLKAKRE